MRRLLPLIILCVIAVVGSLIVARFVGLPGERRPVPGGLPAPPQWIAPVRCEQDPVNLPTPPPGPDGRPANYLHTCGNRIYDAHGREVMITGANWSGMEYNSFAPGGLSSRNWRDILDQVAALGYNTIRVPFSNEGLDPRVRVRNINFDLNPDLQGLSGLEMLDRLIAGARERGLKVILDRHRPAADSQSNLWYTREVSEVRWIADWRMLAARYLGNDTVIAVDLHNEPHGEATWGTGNRATDWRLAAERAGNAVLEVNPYLLVFVDGIEHYRGDSFWWGGQLMGVRDHPVRLNVPNRLVYSPHDYGPEVAGQSWFWDPAYPANLPAEWDRHWGYIHKEGIAPVVVGEFGGISVGDDRAGQWQRALLDYLRTNHIGWLVWTLNPDSWSIGGILTDDWRKVNTEKHAAYQQTLGPPIGTGGTAAFSRAPTRASLMVKPGVSSDRTGTISINAQIVNLGPDPLPLDQLEVRYWFTADDALARDQQVSVEWADHDSGHVIADIVPANQGGQTHYVRIRFAPNAGDLPPYQSSGELRIGVRASGGTSFTQSNDYSVRPASEPSDQFREWERVTLYRNGERIWGNEP